jgi:hypothetical protein
MRIAPAASPSSASEGAAIFAPGHGGSAARGMALAFLTYALFSGADANIKALAGRVPVFEILFFYTIFACAIIFVMRPRGERWRDILRARAGWRCGWSAPRSPACSAPMPSPPSRWPRPIR